jgi:hypothetical protein
MFNNVGGGILPPKDASFNNMLSLVVYRLLVRLQALVGLLLGTISVHFRS